MVQSSIPSRPNPVHLQKAKLLALLDYAMLHPHSRMWIGPLTRLLARKGAQHA
jgi:hypothetical protein